MSLDSSSNSLPASGETESTVIPVQVDKKQKFPYFGSKKILIGAIIGIIVLLVGIVAFGISKYLGFGANKSLPLKAVNVTAAEWKGISDEIKNSVSIQAIEAKVSNNQPKNTKSSNPPVEQFYSSVDSYTDTETATKSATVNSAYGIAHYGFRVKGQLKATASAEPVDFDLQTSLLNAVNAQQSKSLIDIIVNGKLGQLDLEDRDIDALHLSVIRNDDKGAFVNVSMSDLFMVFLSRLFNPKDPNAPKNGLVYATSKDIYPYLDDYVEVKDSRSEQTRTLLIDFLNKYKVYSDNAFKETLGDLSKYATIDKAYEDVANNEAVIRMQMRVDKIALLKQLNDFKNKRAKYSAEHKSEFTQFCETESSSEVCLDGLGYVPEESNVQDTAATGVVLSAIDLQQFDIIVNPPDRKFIGFQGAVVLAPIILSQAPFEKLSFEFTTQELPEETGYDNQIPNKFVTFSDIEKRIIPIEASKSGKVLGVEAADKLFQKNRQLVQILWNKDLEKLGQNKSSTCQTFWAPAFCFQIGSDWAKDELINNKDSVTFRYPPTISLTGPSLSLRFDVNKEIGNYFCNYSSNDIPGQRRYSEYKDITTADGFNLRLSKSAREEKDAFSADVCFKNPNGEYTSVTPYAKSIYVYAQRIDFNKAGDLVVSLLDTLKMQDPSADNLQADFTSDLNKYKTAYLDGAKDDPKSCKIGFYRDEKGESLNYDNIKKDFSINKEFNEVVIKENTAFCQWGETANAKYCLKCIGGKPEGIGFDACKGLSCNP